MTYALAWKSKDEVYMAADTALTSNPDPRTAHVTMSSFGQRHVLNTDNKAVEERVLKLFLKNNIGMAFAGSYSLALRVAASFFTKIEEGVSPRTALEGALFDNRFGTGQNLQLIVGYYENGPQIISFNTEGDLRIKNNEEIVQIGNPLSKHKELTESWIRNSLNDVKDPNMHLCNLLGVFQSYNLFSPQMERGIGGAFCGLYIDKFRGNWQPDILFIEYGGTATKHVGTCFRHNCLVINSPVIGQSRCFGNFLPPKETQAYMYAQLLKAREKGYRLNRTAEYEYVVILAVESLTITVIEMKRKLKHAAIWLQHMKEGAREVTQISIFPKLRELMSQTEVGSHLIYFIPPKIKKVPEDRIVRTEVNYD